MEQEPSPRDGDRRVAVIVPTYRALKFIPQCLDSLEKQRRVDFRIIVSDNGSNDGSVEYIRKNHPNVRVIENKANLGFSAAVNRGLREKGDAPYIALINPDTFVKHNCLARLMDILSRTPAAGIAAPKMMRMDKPTCVDCMGVAVTSAFGQLSIGSGREPIPGFNKRRFVPAACGGGMLIKAEVFERIGEFDEDYFLCWEDLEFSLRAYRSGFKCVFVPWAVIYHAATAIMCHWSEVNVFNYCRGALPTAVKLLPMKHLIALAPLMIFNRLKIALLYAGGGRLLSALKGECSSLALAWRMFRKRRSLPEPRPGFNIVDILKEGDRLRKVMKYNELFPSEQDSEEEIQRFEASLERSKDADKG